MTRLPPVVKSLGIVSLFNDMASEMMYPLLPALITRLGGGALSLGLLDGVSDAISAGAKLVAGRLADQPKLRRGLVVAGYVIAAVVRPLIGFAGHAWHVIALRATDRIGKGVRSPARDAVIAEATPQEIQGKAFGFHRAMDHAGAVIGPVAGWALISYAGMQPTQVIQWSAFPGFLAVVAVFWAMKQQQGTGSREKGTVQPAAPRSGSQLRDAHLSGTFFLIVFFWLFKFPEALLLLRLQHLGVPVAITPLIWAALHVVRTGASYSGGRLSDRLGAAPTMLGGWVVYGVVCLGMATAKTATAGALWFLVFGLVAALTEPPERAFVANLRSRAGAGSRFGIYHAAIGVAALIGGLAFGMLYDRAGGTVALALSAAGTGVLIILGLLSGRSFGNPS